MNNGLARFAERVDGVVQYKVNYMTTSDEEKVNYMNEYIEEILSSEPPQGWHCANVGNISQVSSAKHEMRNYLKNQQYGRVVYQMAGLIRLIERYEREMDIMDRKLHDWLAIERATALGLNVIHIPSSSLTKSYYHCPHCDRSVEVNPLQDRDFK